MRVSKIVRTSLALSACISLLAACGDRAGGFKAKKWTRAEIEANMAAKMAKENAALTGNNTNENAPVAPPPAPGKTGDDNGTGGDPSKKNGNSPNKPAEQKPEDKQTGGPKGPGAQTKVIDENLPAGDQFIKENVALLRALDPSLVKIIPGITSSGAAGTVGNKTAVQISLDAAIMIGKDTRYVIVKPASVTFDEKDNKIVKLTAEVRENADGDGALVTVNDLLILAACQDSNCSQVHVRITIPADGGKVSLAYVLASAGKGQYQVADSNLKDKWVEFKTWLEKTKKEKRPENVDTTVDQGGAKGKPTTGGGDEQGGSTVDKNGKGDSDKTAAEKKAAEEKAAAEKKAAEEKAAADKAAADKKAADDKAAADKKAADDKAAADKAAGDRAAAGAIFGGNQSGQKSVAFKPVNNQPSNADLAKDTTSAGKTFQMTQDPGPFKFDSQKGPGIFGTTNGLTGNAVKSAESKPAAAAANSLRGKSAEMDAMADAFSGDMGAPLESTTVGQAPAQQTAKPNSNMKTFGGEGDAVTTAPALSDEQVQDAINKGF